MPKEITHFALAGCLSRELTEEGLFQGPVHRFHRLFLLGAVAPDIPFYYLAGRKKSGVQALSQPFHRPDATALAPVLAFLDQNRSPQALALAAGVVSHLMADTHFHPLVYYYAGMEGEHPGATGRHRMFETAMDLHFWHLFRGETRLNRVVKGVEVSTVCLRRLLAELFRPGSGLDDWGPIAALGWHRRILLLFTSSGVRKILAWLNQVNLPLSPVYAGLVYPFGGPRHLPFFAAPLRFRHPCSGQALVRTLPGLIRESVSSAKNLLEIIARALADGRAGAALFQELPQIRPSLPETGCVTWLGDQDIGSRVYRGCDPAF